MIAIIIKECGALTNLEISNVQVNMEFISIIPKIVHWMKVDFHPLHEPRYDYEKQIKLTPIESTTTAMVHFGLDPSMFKC